MKFVSCIYIFLIGLLIYSVNTGSPPEWLGALRAIPMGDQVGHFVLIGLVSLACNILLDFKQIAICRRKVFLGAAVIAVVATVEEFSQLFIQVRTFSIADLVANYLGILVLGHFVSRAIHHSRASADQS